jgi:hypothetical protein
MKRLFSLSAVIFWLVMVTLLARKHLFLESPHPVTPPSPVSVEESREEWKGVYYNNHKVGYIYQHLFPSATGYQWEEEWRLRLQFLGTPQAIHTKIKAHTDKAYALTKFSFRLSASGLTFMATGKVSNNTLEGEITTGGHTSPFSLPLSQPLYLPSTAQTALKHNPLQAGERREFTVFNPLSLKPETLIVTAMGPELTRIHNQEVETIKETVQFGGTTLTSWVDNKGNVVKEEAPLGLVLIREEKEQALSGEWQNTMPPDIALATAIPVRHPIPSPRTLAFLQIKISALQDGPLDEPFNPSASLRAGFDPAQDRSFAFPPRQTQEGEVLAITAEDPASLQSYALPLTDPQFAADLAPSPFLQSTHPRIVQLAASLLAGEKDALQATKHLLAWTYQTLDKVPTAGMPTALEALESGRGDCNEHAVLFTALARAAGIPARIAAGMVYMDSAFYYHAWSEVWMGKWVSIDPVLDQFPADATHIKFVEGGPEEHTALLKIIGQVAMEVLDYR